MAANKYSYFEFLFDKSGERLKTYLEDEKSDPPPWELCKQLIEKSLAIANAASVSQGTTESELKVYEAQRIWQPLCLAMTTMSHLKWDLDLLQQKVPLHLQQIFMEELLKGYGISQVPKPEDFDINKYSKRAAMVHIIYNRWVVRTITKYEEFKEKDQLPNNLSTAQREMKENQELQIFMKVKEFRTLSIDILEKSIYLSSDVEIPLPRPRLVTATEIIPTDNKELMQIESNEMISKDDLDNKHDGKMMKVPDVLDVVIPVSKDEILIKICFDLGCYYFPKELYGDASRMFQKTMDIINVSKVKDIKNTIDYKKLLGYHNACRLMEKEALSTRTEISDLCFRLEQSSQNEYKDILTVLKEDNLTRDIPYTQRLNIEKELFLLDKKDDLFIVCVLNFIRCCLDNQALPSSFYQSLRYASKKELRLFSQQCKECLDKLTSDNLVKRLEDGVRLVFEMLPTTEKCYLLKDSNFRPFIEKSKTSSYGTSTKKRKLQKDLSKDDDDDDGCIDDDDDDECDLGDIDKITFIEPSQEERIISIVKLRAKLSTCYDPETIKDILFEIHQVSPDKSHAIGYEFPLYQDILQEIQDLLMYDTVHVFMTKAKQMTMKHEKGTSQDVDVKNQKFTKALSLLSICVETLKSYATKASPSCSVGRVKNLLHHELLWTELNFAEADPDNANIQETRRRSKACITHSQHQDPPPHQHIYQAIVIHLLNAKEFQFLCDAGVTHDVMVVDALQLSFHLSSVVCGLQRGVEVLRSAAKGLWDTVLRVIASKSDGSLQLPPSQQQQQGAVPQPIQPIYSSRGPLEDKHMRDLQCFIRKDELVGIMTQLKDDTILSLLLSCLTSLLASTLPDNNLMETKDSYSHLWPSSCDGSVSTTSVEVLSVLKPLCTYCLQKNSRNISWLRTIGDVFIVCGDYKEAMRCYLEVGSLTTSFFSRPVPYSVWDEKIYRNMISCCEKEKAYTQVIVLSQFLEPVDYTTAFKAIQEKSSADGMEVFYDCLWDVNLLEYLIYAHDKRGEVEKRRLVVKTIGQPELNTRSSPEILQQTKDIRKTKFLRTLSRLYWT